MCWTTQPHLQVERSSSTVAARSHTQKHLQQMELRNLRPSVLTYGTLAGYLKTVHVEWDLQSCGQDEHGRDGVSRVSVYCFGDRALALLVPIEISSHPRCQRTPMLVMSRLPKDGMTRLSRYTFRVSFLTPAVLTKRRSTLRRRIVESRNFLALQALTARGKGNAVLLAVMLKAYVKAGPIL